MAVTRIGLLGGSFDPIHLAHVALARAARRELELDEVQLVPAANPWQRAPLLASPDHRLAMIQLAIAGESGLSINTEEIERGGQTYTLDTVQALPEGPHYVWLLGADQLANFCTWRGWREIVQRVQLAVAVRPGASLTPPAPLQALLREQDRALLTLPFEPMAVSATEIRQRLARGEPTAGLLPEAVAQYIDRHGLYREPAGT
ncbi:nicotinate (nicotinamide) nucleotide adenylyltransferase [Orrella sp. JC864]|uniref:nicotinate (nicotinamide) nucleotide adenylyltransferase n=1 Tax=Orrella sp. JC864 TaxID=3120298 RepID=UPI00300BA399